MQDKEFDQLFKDKFDDAQIEPSSHLWGNIEAELAPKKKRVLPIYWMAAAMVAVTLSVALLVFNKEEKVQLQGRTADVLKPIAPITSNAQPIVTDEDNSVTDQPALAGTNTARSTVGSAGLTVARIVAVKEGKLDGTVDNHPVKNNLGLMQPNPAIAHLTIRDAKVKEPAVVLQEVRVIPVDEIVIASADVPSNTEDEVSNENEMADKRGIRNMGDLINFVVDKVDKREDKVIQFNTDDDDNSSVVGINIGMLKFSKKRHK